MFAVILSVHIIICVFLVILILLQRSEGGGLGIGQAGGSGGLGDFLTARSTSNILTKTTSFLAFCFQKLRKLASSCRFSRTLKTSHQNNRRWRNIHL